MGNPLCNGLCLTHDDCSPWIAASFLCTMVQPLRERLGCLRPSTGPHPCCIRTTSRSYGEWQASAPVVEPLVIRGCRRQKNPQYVFEYSFTTVPRTSHSPLPIRRDLHTKNISSLSSFIRRCVRASGGGWTASVRPLVL